ncbi:Tudor domain containing 3 [Carabus blaptoides fortunei]
MPRNDVERLKQIFKSKFQHVSDYWLECCIDWFKEQHTDYTQQYMDDIIIQQWLETDLREIEVSCLPPNLSKEKKLILRGNYAMQIMYFRDISKPALSQLRDIRNMYNLTRNHMDNENETNNSANRVLYFQMTDGVQLINGFEYQSIPVLNINLKPGIKVLLLGPVLVQNGEFILKPNNVKILGGEVEDLLVTNAVENVLARELNLPINPNPGQAIVIANNPAQNKSTVTNVVQNTATQQSTIPNRQNGAAASRTNTTTSRNQTNQKNNVQRQSNVIVIESDEEDMLMAQLDASENAHNNVQSRQQDLDDEEEMLLAHLDACESTSYAQSTRRQNSRSNINAYQQDIDDDEEDMLLAQLDACESKYGSNQHVQNLTDDLNIDSNMFNDTNFSDQANKSKSHNSSVKNYDSINDTALLNIDIPEIDENIIIDEDDDNKPRPTLSQEYFNFDIEDDLALMAELDSDIAEQMKVKIPLIETVEPFVYIKQLLDNREKITTEKYTVKARFTRVIERINVSKEKGWSMQFEISDGTGNVVVDFLSNVLEGVMGLTPTEALEEKMNVKRKKLVAFEKLTKALIMCKQKLQAFDGLIDLQFKEGIDIATITSMEQMKRRHLDQLNGRIESAKVKFQ